MPAPLTLHAYKASFDITALQTAVKAFLSHADKIEHVQNHLEWSTPQDLQFLNEAFPPQSDVKNFWLLFDQIQKQSKLKKRRLQAGFAELKGERKGLRGWWQKRYDKKELALPIGADAFEWLQQSQRLHLLASIHDSFLARVMIAEAQEIELEEMDSSLNPLAEIILHHDRNRAKNLIHALQSPLHKISPDFLISEIRGYVTYNLDTKFAYYYA